MTTNKAELMKAVAPWESKLQEGPFLSGPAFCLADAVAVADLRAAFEKVWPASWNCDLLSQTPL
jgi:glutathione S-transferase